MYPHRLNSHVTGGGVMTTGFMEQEEVMLEIGWAQIVNDHVCKAMHFGINAG